MLIYLVCNKLRWFGEGEGESGENGGGGAGSESKTLTVEEHNAILAAERSKAEKSIREYTTKLADWEKRFSGTETEKQAVMEELRQLKEKNMTAEELAQQREQEVREKMLAENEQYKKAAVEWETRFKTSQMESQIKAAANSLEAYNPDQIYSMLSREAKVVEEVDAQGNKTGVTVMIPTKVKDKGVVDMPLLHALEAMKKNPEHANLFKSEAKGGFGTVPNSGKAKGGSPLDASSTEEMMAEFRKMNMGQA